MRRKTIRMRRGVLAVEMITGIVVSGVMMGLLLHSSWGYVRVRERLMTDRVLRLAAEAQFERVRAGLGPETLPPGGILPPGVALKTVTEPGRGAWAGMTLMTVTATATDGKGVRYERVLSGYLPGRVATRGSRD